MLEPDLQHRCSCAPGKELHLGYLGFHLLPFPAGQVSQAVRLQDWPGTAVLHASFASFFRNTLAHSPEEHLPGHLVLFQLLGDLAGRLFEDRSSSALSKAETLAEKAKEFIQLQHDRPLATQEIASSLYLSPHHLTRVFCQVTGMTMKQYHEALRMQLAARLLRKDQRPVKEVAHDLHFSSIHYFSRRFKKFFGYSPAQFRGQAFP